MSSADRSRSRSRFPTRSGNIPWAGKIREKAMSIVELTRDFDVPVVSGVSKSNVLSSREMKAKRYTRLAKIEEQHFLGKEYGAVIVRRKTNNRTRLVCSRNVCSRSCRDI